MMSTFCNRTGPFHIRMSLMNRPDSVSTGRDIPNKIEDSWVCKSIRHSIVNAHIGIRACKFM